jgi:hypothetical protein
MEMKSNKKIKFVIFQEQNLWFSTAKYLQLSLFPQNCVLKILFLFPKSF